MPGNTIGLAIEFAIGNPFVTMDHGAFFRKSPGALFQKMVYKSVFSHVNHKHPKKLFSRSDAEKTLKSENLPATDNRG
jgi:hypothetical protein